MTNSPDIETIAFAYTKPTEYILFMLGLIVLSILCVIFITKEIAVPGLPCQKAPFLLKDADV